MVKSGQGAVRRVDFASAHHADLPVEVASAADVARRVGPDLYRRPDRPSFTVLLLVHAGSGHHTIDFERLPLRPGLMMRVRPAQLQTWDPTADLDASVVLSSVTPAHAAPWTPDGVPGRDLDAPLLATVEGLIDAARSEQERFDGGVHSRRLLVALFDALDASFERAGESSPAAQLPEPYVAYRSAIERDLRAHLHVRDFADRLGYSERTLSRACQRVTGLTAKGVLNERLVLEAKRLLAHTDDTAAAVGASLGFAEASNFHRFFHREVGIRPTAFRSAIRDAAGSGGEPDGDIGR